MQPSGDIDSGLRKSVELRDQSQRIDHDARADDRMLARAQDPARNQLQDETIPVVDNRVPRVVPARATRDEIERGRKVVHNLALAFITPLRTYDYNRLRSEEHPAELQS